MITEILVVDPHFNPITFPVYGMQAVKTWIVKAGRSPSYVLVVQFDAENPAQQVVPYALQQLLRDM